MKKIIFLLTIGVFSNFLVAQERLASNSFRKVPAKELKTFMQNEASLSWATKKLEKTPIVSKKIICFILIDL